MIIRSVRSALEFLTVVPVGRSTQPTPPGLGRAWFPAVGALVGLAGGLVFMLLGALVTPLFAAVAAVATCALITGGLHLDGLADAADGLLGGGTPERRLEIMRDPRVGSFGVIAVVLVLVADVALLGVMSPARALAGLVIAGALSRLAMVGVIAAVPYVRPDGLGTLVQGGHRARDLVIGVVLVAVACLLDYRRAVAAAVLVALATILLIGLARRRIGGATGDVYGACAELGQTAALIAFAVR